MSRLKLFQILRCLILFCPVATASYFVIAHAGYETDRIRILSPPSPWLSPCTVQDYDIMLVWCHSYHFHFPFNVYIL